MTCLALDFVFTIAFLSKVFLSWKLVLNNNATQMESPKITMGNSLFLYLLCRLKTLLTATIISVWRMRDMASLATTVLFEVLDLAVAMLAVMIPLLSPFPACSVDSLFIGGLALVSCLLALTLKPEASSAVNWVTSCWISTREKLLSLTSCTLVVKVFQFSF